MASLVSASDLVKASKIAFDIYQMGWSKELNATVQFNEFGEDIRGLGQNLKDVVTVVTNATQQQSGGNKFWDLSSLEEIIGDYNRTLADCRALLQENHQVSQRTNPVYSVQWNVLVQPRITRLQTRLQFHNSKIAILLKPLELKLLTEVHDDLASRINAVHREVLNLKSLIVPNINEAIRQRGQQQTYNLDVPSSISTQFVDVAEKDYPDIRALGKFPLKAGADAFVFHFNKSTRNFTPGRFVQQRTPCALQYLSLLKCIWIMSYLKTSNELVIAGSESHWPDYIKQLEENLALECQRFEPGRYDQLMAPPLDEVSSEDFSIWLADELQSLLSPFQETEMREQILRVRLPSSSSSVKHELSLFKTGPYKMTVAEKVVDTSSQTSRSADRELDFDLRTVKLIPMYAMPSSLSSRNLIIIAENKTSTFTFSETRHILKFQHAITGYKVYEGYDQSEVRASFVLSGSREIKADVRIQLWLPKSMHSSTMSANESNASVQTTIPIPLSSPNFGSYTSVNASNRMASPTPLGSRRLLPLNTINQPNGSTSGFLDIPSPISPSRLSRRTSTIYSASSSMSTGSSSISAISTGSGKGRLHTKPPKPMMVLFVKEREQGSKLSLVTIEIDDQSYINRDNCRCNRAKSDCHYSAIERKGNLIAHRYVADDGLNGWDAAVLAITRQRDSRTAWEGLKRVNLKFKELKDREHFAGQMCNCNIKMTNDMKRCILEGHRGFYGEIQHIGNQRLQNYHADWSSSWKQNFSERPDAWS